MSNAGLERQLRQLLLRCDQLQSDATLRALFADPRLWQWRNQLPQADTASARVEALLAFLRDAGGNQAVTRLLEVLAERFDLGDERHHELLQLAGLLPTEVEEDALVVAESPSTARDRPWVMRVGLFFALLALGLTVYWIARQFADSSCNLKVYDIHLSRERVRANEPVQANFGYSLDVALEDRWQVDWWATNGTMQPGLGANRYLVTYLPPHRQASDTISVEVRAPSCEPIRRTRNVVVQDPLQLDGPIPTPVTAIIEVEYIVQPGDTLARIAEKQPTTVEMLLAYGIDAVDLAPGVMLYLPVANPDYCPGGTPYIVRPGDTIASLAVKFDTAVETIVRLSGLWPGDSIHPGELICVPANQ